MVTSLSLLAARRPVPSPVKVLPLMTMSPEEMLKGSTLTYPTASPPWIRSAFSVFRMASCISNLAISSVPAYELMRALMASMRSLRTSISELPLSME
ncbi:hypothetical protein DSECCO2_593900 [anaerobic digester metagenome]